MGRENKAVCDGISKRREEKVNQLKVAVITRHAITNYGSLLQAIATQHIVERLGHECRIIDYIRTDETFRKEERTVLKNKPQYNGNALKRAAYLAVRQPTAVFSGKRFAAMRKKYLRLTKNYASLEELTRDKPAADIYMTGSDQVWGPVMSGEYDSAYCLSFTDDADRRVALSASFGRTEFSPEVQEFYQKWLARYDGISVREDSGVRLLRDWGIDAVQTADPTLLLDSEFWGNLTVPVDKKYVLIYQIGNNKQMDRYAKAVAKKSGLPLVRLSASFHQMFRGGKFIYCPDISVFLSYIKNAQCLITNSFHGTAFALNFNTPFVEVLPGETKTRNMSLLRLTGLTDRVLQNEEDVDLAFKTIDFTHANEVLAEQRKEGVQILSRMIGEKA